MSVIALFPDFYQGLYDRLTGGWGHDLTANQWLGTVIAIGVLKWIGMWLILLWRPLRLALTPRAIKAQRLRDRAFDLFRVGTEARTIGRTGLRSAERRVGKECVSSCTSWWSPFI